MMTRPFPSGASVADRIADTEALLPEKREAIAQLLKSEAEALADGKATTELRKKRITLESEIESGELLLNELRLRLPAEEAPVLRKALESARAAEAAALQERKAKHAAREAADAAAERADREHRAAYQAWDHACNNLFRAQDKLREHYIAHPNLHPDLTLGVNI